MRTLIEPAPFLTKLDLAGNNFGDGLLAARSTARATHGTAAVPLGSLPAALAGLSHLRRLDLSWNDLDEAGALLVLRALSCLRALEYVDLRFNPRLMLAQGLSSLCASDMPSVVVRIGGIDLDDDTLWSTVGT